MATIMKQQAVDRLTRSVAKARPDDLVEIYNELFPEQPAAWAGAEGDPSALAGKIAAHIKGGLEVEEILDLWNVVYPRERAGWYDEEEGLIHYDEKTEPVGQAE